MVVLVAAQPRTLCSTRCARVARQHGPDGTGGWLARAASNLARAGYRYFFSAASRRRDQRTASGSEARTTGTGATGCPPPTLMSTGHFARLRHFRGSLTHHRVWSLSSALDGMGYQSIHPHSISTSRWPCASRLFRSRFPAYRGPSWVSPSRLSALLIAAPLHPLRARRWRCGRLRTPTAKSGSPGSELTRDRVRAVVPPAQEERRATPARASMRAHELWKCASCVRASERLETSCLLHAGAWPSSRKSWRRSGLRPRNELAASSISRPMIGGRWRLRA